MSTSRDLQIQAKKIVVLVPEIEESAVPACERRGGTKSGAGGAGGGRINFGDRAGSVDGGTCAYDVPTEKDCGECSDSIEQREWLEFICGDLSAMGLATTNTARAPECDISVTC